MARLTLALAVCCVLLITEQAQAQTTLGPPRDVSVHVIGGEILVNWLPFHAGERPSVYLLTFRRVSGETVALVTAAGLEFRAVAPPGTAGDFEVTVSSLIGDTVGPSSAPVRFTLGAPCVPPSPPSGLTSSLSGTLLLLLWNGGANASEYVLEAGTRSGLADLYNQSVGYRTGLDATVPAGLHAFIRVRSRNACGTSEPSNEIELTNSGAVRWRGVTAQGRFVEFDVEGGAVLNFRMPVIASSSNPLCDNYQVYLGWQAPVPIVGGAFASARSDNAWRLSGRFDGPQASGSATFEFVYTINDAPCTTGGSTTWTATPQ